MIARPGVATVTEPSGLQHLVDEWHQLLAASPAPSYFSTPDWAMSWWEHFAPGAPVRLATWRDAEGSLLALAPLVEHRERLHARLPVTTTSWTVLGAGAGSGDHVQIPALPSAHEAVGDWFVGVAGERSLMLPSLDPAATPWRLSLPGAVELRRTPCPRLDLTGGPSTWGSAGFRKRRAYYRRRLDQAGVTFDRVAPGAFDDDLLASLYDLHEARWRLDGQTSTGLRDRDPFFRALRTRGTADRGPCGVVARFGDEVIGVLLGFRYRDVFSYFQTGWHPDWKPFDLGTALVDAAVEAAADDGASVFDFLRGAEEYKYRFGAVDRHDVSVLVPHGPQGAALKAKYRHAAR